ncbi:MAG TPA: FAD-binding oxidoreductase, partial [Planctomycetota bacterium]|nr:FAD-binding oxidoreductase [Planctomycetota bacterium]
MTIEQALARELRGDVRADDYTRHLYAGDASLYATAPLLVAFPRDADDVAAAIRAAAGDDRHAEARGGGTSLAGQAVGGHGIVLDTSRHMDAIHEIDVAGRHALVGPGVVQDDLNRAAATHGLAFGPDTSTSNRATIGGMIGNNSSGSHSIVYGTTIDHVHELEVVLSDGSRATFGPVSEAERARRAQADTLEGRLYRDLPGILRRHARAIAEDYPRHWRQSGGYRLDALARGFDLAKLVTGSEGTLAAITGARVALIELPAARQFVVGHFHTVDEAVAATHDALDLQPAAVEMIDATILELSRSKREYAQMASRIEGDPGALLY